MRRAQVVPVADRVHRLVADDLFQQIRRRRPVDGPQHEEAAIEPGREQVDEIVVDGGEIVAMIHRVEQLLAHAHQRRRAAGREIEAAEQLEPPRLGCAMELGRGGVRGRVHPGGGRGAEPGTVGAEPARQRLEKGNARPGVQLGIAGQDFARERDARGFAAAREQILAQMRKVGRALLGDLAPVARRPARGRAPRWTATFRRKRRYSPDGPNLSPSRPIR